MRFCRLFLLAGLIPFNLVAAEDPIIDPSQNACDCNPDKEVVDWNCTGWVVEANIHVLRVGKCDVAPCQEDSCRWEFDMSANCGSCGTVTLYVDGAPRASGQNQFVLLSRTATKACDEGEVWALGTPAGPCVEVMMYCDPCGL